MEPAKIDWKKIDSIFVPDSLYENINAPTWVDFLAPESQDSIDDEAWFCKPDCNHPKTAEDFVTTTPISKLSSSAHKLKTTLCNWNQRDAKLKRRVPSQFYILSSEDGENKNPNLSTPPNQQVESMKSMIKSSTETKKPFDDVLQNNEAPRLKSTLSARNLFAGKDIITNITEFCNDLKKMAMRARERENEGKLNDIDNKVEGKKVEVDGDESSRKVLGEIDVKEKERKPLLEVGTEKSEGSMKEKQGIKKRVDDAENIPVSLNLTNLKNKEEERVLQIRTNPPSPQCFSAARVPTKKVSKARQMEREILQEVKQNKEMTKEEKEDRGRNFSIVDVKDTKPLDVFWFLKPCTLS